MPKKEVYVLAYTSIDEAGKTLYWCDVSADRLTHERAREYAESHGFTILFESLQDVEGREEEEDEQ